MNCLEYALEFWQKEPEYRIYYNSDHVINLPKGTDVTGFLPLEQFGFEHISNSFTLSGKATEQLIKYFK